MALEGRFFAVNESRKSIEGRIRLRRERPEEFSDRQADWLVAHIESSKTDRMRCRPHLSEIPDATPMNANSTPITILMADDDPDDRALTAATLKEARLTNELRFVENGEELLNYLRAEGKYAPPASAPRPGLILLDLNMPRKDGRTVLKELRQDSELNSIPVIVLTTSKDDEDIYRSYDLGVSSYVVKPVTFEALTDTLQMLKKYSFQIVE